MCKCVRGTLEEPGGAAGAQREQSGNTAGKVRARFGGAAVEPRGSQRQTPLWTSLWDFYNTFTRTL